MNERASLVFFGSGPVAARSLELLSMSFTIEAIITKPATVSDMQAIGKQLPIYTATSKRELDALFMTTKFKSEVAVIIDFGIIVSQTLIDSFAYGIVNSHFSLLPQWRGADPITFAVLSGQRQTGVSIMLLTAGMDEGPLLAQAPYDIPEGTTTPTLTASLIELSDATLKSVLPDYLSGYIVPMPQQEASLLAGLPPTYSRKLTKADGIIDWSKPAAQLEREIRAFITWPKSQTTIAKRSVIIVDAYASDIQGKPGDVLVNGKQLFIYCGKGALDIRQLKPAGKSVMSAKAFLAGYMKLI